MTETSRTRAGEQQAEALLRFERAARSWLNGGAAATAAAAEARGLTEAGVVTTAVLVEGDSDRAALQALAESNGRDLGDERVAVLPMGGAMSIRRYVEALGSRGLDLELHGLCDQGEVRFFERAGMRASAFEICDPDLEGELIRALGLDAAEQVLDEQGDLRLFRTFQRQPAQRERPAEQQLHRFLGTTSGRKEQYGRELALRAAADAVAPAPLRRLLAAV
ncbi:TOPRIM nucleotidyl transferase/hydrolase domain-containing protein [Leifsonia sp. NPDC058230]|uniref:TOPRIM nucleotidyl transferase/hydrolase domain-containing protein n=1 Tax=Leifsonia sp. NPDC058230 TaxID=3346391 RepID=UPI0036DC6B52